ncbi:MAG: hypothetical protein JRI56_02205 [Deltaproteobacteria bacterium]|nr:hypothetical protein [Deltaproteobacteria bacterium]
MANQSKASCDFDKVADSYGNWYNSVTGSMYDSNEEKTRNSLIGNHNDGKQLLEIGWGTDRCANTSAKKGSR